MDWLNRDLRVGLRLLARDKAFSITVALTLASCIGRRYSVIQLVTGKASDVARSVSAVTGATSSVRLR